MKMIENQYIFRLVLTIERFLASNLKCSKQEICICNNGVAADAADDDDEGDNDDDDNDVDDDDS